MGDAFGENAVLVRRREEFHTFSSHLHGFDLCGSTCACAQLQRCQTDPEEKKKNSVALHRNLSILIFIEFLIKQVKSFTAKCI